MAGGEQAVLLALCDISGYTRFMVAHRESLVHGQVVITELMEAILREAKMPLVVSKLEGDAVFLYAVQQGADPKPLARDVLARIDRFFGAFEEKLAELTQSNICSCGACRNIESLRLKVVLHLGTALLHNVGGFMELAGTDVILAHRLLKNSAGEDQYLLLTEQAQEAGGLDLSRARAGEETYESLGAVRTYLYLPPLGLAPLPERHDYTTRAYRAKNILRRIWQARLTFLGLKRPPAFRNLPAPDEQAP